MTNSTFNKVDWTALDNALNDLKLQQQAKVIKYMHNWLLIHGQAQKFNHQASDLCSVCVLVKEMSQHLFQCKHESSICARIAALTQLRADLTLLRTAPILKE
eukprot:11701013-Ditylum_brightwellii.AAC.1